MRQNVIIALLSFIAAMLLVLVVQNINNNAMLAQTGGGVAATTGVIGVATGTIQGADAAGFWIYEPTKQKIMVYDYGRTHLRLRSVRDISYDMQAPDFNLKGQTGPKVSEMKSAIEKLKK